MSAALYATRLYWDSRRGVAKHAGVSVELAYRPQIEPILRDLVEIDFTPEVHVARVRESGHGWRDMTEHEMRAAQAWLAIVSTAALTAAHQA